MPFGLSNAPTTFQALMNSVFNFAVCKYVLIFFDEILVYIKDLGSHLIHLEKVLMTLEEYKLYSKYSKCYFGLLQIEYLGHVISVVGVHMDKSKVEAILQWPSPSSVK